MKYAKIINGILTFPPRNKDNIINYCLNEEMLIEDGYKPLIEAIKPEGHYKAEYVEEENQIVETWTDISEEIFLAKKSEKYAENQQKLDIARISHKFKVTLQGQECDFDTKDKTQNDLNSAAISVTLGLPWIWTTNNRIILHLTSEDIQIISSAYLQTVNKDIVKWTYYDELIELAETLEELNEIEIDYDDFDV